jgi:hypothetical protein
MNYDLGYVDLERKLCSPLKIPSGQKCNPCLRNVLLPMSPGRTKGCMASPERRFKNSGFVAHRNVLQAGARDGIDGHYTPYGIPAAGTNPKANLSTSAASI